MGKACTVATVVKRHAKKRRMGGRLHRVDANQRMRPCRLINDPLAPLPGSLHGKPCPRLACPFRGGGGTLDLRSEGLLAR